MFSLHGNYFRKAIQRGLCAWGSPSVSCTVPWDIAGGVVVRGGGGGWFVGGGGVEGGGGGGGGGGGRLCLERGVQGSETRGRG